MRSHGERVRTVVLAGQGGTAGRHCGRTRWVQARVNSVAQRT